MGAPLWIIASATLATGAPEAQPDEIIVTGERAPRTLLETSSSVAVATEEMIEAQAAADRIEQLLALVPNVQLGSGGEGPTIRGQDSTGVLRDLPAFLGGTRPRVTLQVDGRAVSFNEFVFGAAPIWDVERVEVFRSPQTTTQGRNSIGGAIFLHTNDPTYDWQGRARGLIGDYDTRQASAVLSGPIVADQFAFRVAGDLRRSRPSSDIDSLAVGATADHDDHELVRAKLLAEPKALPGARLELGYVHTRSEAPQIEGVEAPFRARRDLRAAYGIFATNVDSLTGVLSYALSPTLDSETTLSWGDARVRRFAPPGLGQTLTRTRDFSVESILRWRPDGPLRLLAGAHHLRARQTQFIDISAFIGRGDFVDVQHSFGLFGEAAWRPLPRIELTAGLRYQRDRQDRAGAIVGAADGIGLDFDRSFDAWLPKLSLAYELGAAARIGVLAQRAYNPGGTTISFVTGGGDPFDAETLWNYELFARVSLGRLTLAANLFRTEISNAQRPQLRTILAPDGEPLFVAEFANAPKAHSEGAEIELSWRAGPALSLRAGLGLLDTRVDETLDPADPLLGKQFQRAPHLTASAAADWRPTDRLRLSAQLRHNSAYFSDDANTPALRIAGSTTVDARTAWETGPLTLFGYVRNVFDEFHLTYLFAPDFGTAGDPREFGVGVEARF